MKAYESYKKMPPWAQGIIGVVVVVGGALAIYSIVRSIKRSKELADANKAAKDADKELADLQSKGINPTKSDSEFESMAQTLVQAMNGCGTNNQQVYDTFDKLRNEADVRKLISIFGVRYYMPCWITQADAYAIWLFNDQKYGGGLPTWLSYDMSAKQISNINDIMKKNGINYTF